MESIKEFKNEHINYLKKKLRKINIIKASHVNECMNLLNLGESICTTGVADKMIMIGHLIFSVLGNNKLDVMAMDHDERLIFNQMVDELGPLIPKAIKNIIDISKEYETRICNTPTNTTLLLERLYMDLYDKQTEINIDLSSYIEFDALTEMGWNKFLKTVILMGILGYLLSLILNIILPMIYKVMIQNKVMIQTNIKSVKFVLVK